jgi:hypothetical protein
MMSVARPFPGGAANVRSCLGGGRPVVTAPVPARSRLAVPIVAVVLGALVLCGSAGTALWRGISNSVAPTC